MAHSLTAIAVNMGNALADLVAVLASFAIAYQAYRFVIITGVFEQDLPASPTPYVIIALLFTAMAMLVFWYLGMYTERASLLNLMEIRTALKGLVLTAAFLFASLFFLNLHFSRLVVVGSISIACILVVLERRLFYSLINKLHVSGKLGKRVLIYGGGETGRLVMKKIVHAPHLGATVVGFLDDQLPTGHKITCRLSQDGPTFLVPVLGGIGDLRQVVSTHGVNELLVAMASTTSERLREIFELAHACGIRAAAVPHLGGVRVDQLKVDDLSAIPILRPYPVRARRFHALAKRLFDLAMGVMLALLTLPMWLGAALMIRLGSSGPILFSQVRVGLRGRQFRMYKFRTMRTDTDPYARSPSGDRSDRRITGAGRILRATGVDELPQLLNVMRGQMSLVGPRPEMPFIVDQYSATEKLRLNAKPGLTGLWQISADRHAQIHENIEYDLYYINHQSILLDLLILLETVLFTIGLALKAFRGKEETRGTGQEKPESSPYILVAMDPAASGNQPNSWRTWMGVVDGMSWRWPVKILEPGNGTGVDDARTDALAPPGAGTTRVNHYTQADLKALVTGARLLITDMAEVKELADEAGIEALLVVAGPGRLQRERTDRSQSLRVSQVQ
jgi:exopolysaccharide biosynthesis polyprenyl glycosylphosphotransferase